MKNGEHGDLMENFRDFLRSSGLKLTSQRMTILDKLIAMKGHRSADEIIDILKGEGLNVSKATMYRLLSLLKQSGCFNEHDFGLGRKYYEFTRGKKHHDHLYCVKCGGVREFRTPAIEKLQDQAARKLKFKAIYHSHNIFGYCAKCVRRHHLNRM